MYATAASGNAIASQDEACVTARLYLGSDMNLTVQSTFGALMKTAWVNLF